MFGLASSLIGSALRGATAAITIPVAAVEDAAATVIDGDSSFENLRKEADKLADEAREIAKIFD